MRTPDEAHGAGALTQSKPVLLLIALGVLLIGLSSLKQLGGYGVETDFYGSFVPEASRFIAGEPLVLRWQPPLYPILLAPVYALTGDWFRSGLVISIAASLVAVLASFRLFRGMFTDTEAWGAAMGLVLWVGFWPLAISASSDMLFLALALSCLAVAVHKSPITIGRSVLSGLLGGLAALTRTNGISLLLVVLMCASRASARRWPAIAAGVLGGFALPWIAWLLLSEATGSPFFPTDNYVNAAVMLYGTDGQSMSQNSDNWPAIQERFGSFIDVLLFDPPTVVRVLVGNFARSLLRIFEVWGRLTWLAAALALPGLGWLLWTSRSRLTLAFWLVCLAQYGLLTLIFFQPRYYLFFVPAFTAGCFSLGKAGLGAILPSKASRPRVWAAVVAVSLLPFLAFDALTVARLLRNQPTEVFEAANLLAEVSSGRERIVSRKPHLPFYSGLARAEFPNARDLEELRADVCQEDDLDGSFLFFGSMERSLRPQLESLLDSRIAPAWLRSIGNGGPPGASWALYQIECSRAGTPARQTGSEPALVPRVSGF